MNALNFAPIYMEVATRLNTSWLAHKGSTTDLVYIAFNNARLALAAAITGGVLGTVETALAALQDPLEALGDRMDLFPTPTGILNYYQSITIYRKGGEHMPNSPIIVTQVPSFLQGVSTAPAPESGEDPGIEPGTTL